MAYLIVYFFIGIVYLILSDILSTKDISLALYFLRIVFFVSLWPLFLLSVLLKYGRIYKHLKAKAILRIILFRSINVEKNEESFNGPFSFDD